MTTTHSEKRILKSLLDISGFMNYVENPDLILSLIVEECALLTRAEWGAILSYDERLDLDTCKFTRVLEEKDREMIAALLNDKIKGAIEKNGIDEALTDAFWSKKSASSALKKALGKSGEDVMACPLTRKGVFLGIAVVVNKLEKGSFKKKDKEALAILCQEASIVLENIRLFKEKVQSERMAAIGQTIAGISHYVKNILQGITSGSYLLNSGIKSNELDIVKEAWAVVDRNTKRISELVLDMLYYSKERKIAKEKVDPAELVADVAELVKARCKENDIKFKVSIDGLPRTIMANEKSLHRSILNLLTNAIDACEKKGSVIKLTASSDKRNSSVVIAVSDSGKGISSEEREKLFQPFYSKKAKGTGLGLAITKKVVEEHNGTIKVESEPGSGATFEISIPA